MLDKKNLRDECLNRTANFVLFYDFKIECRLVLNLPCRVGGDIVQEGELDFIKRSFLNIKLILVRGLENYDDKEHWLLLRRT